MGELYEAEDHELHEHVALKTIRPEIAQNDVVVERFKREVQLARQVTHANVCRIFDVFYHREPAGNSSRATGDVLFVTMELLNGETLAERIHRQGRIAPSEALPLLEQMAAALTAAHQAGVVHRDFKSSNIMLLPPKHGAIERVSVTDFGLARQSSQDADASAAATRTADVWGTPAYMAPEQIEGGEATPATDIYAMGVVMFEMLTGVRPFAGDGPLVTAVKRLREPAPSPRTLVPALEAEWDAAILRCLERQPADRFQNATDVIAALRGDATTRTVKAPQRLSPARFGRFAIGAVLLILLGLAAGFLATKAKSNPPPAVDQARADRIQARRSVAVLGFKNLSGRSESAWLSTAFAELLTTELAAGEKLRTIPGESVARVKSDLGLADADSFATDTLARIRSNIGSDVVVLGSYLAVAGGKIRLDVRLQDAAAGETIATLSDTATETEVLDLMSRTGARLRETLGVGQLLATQVSGVRAATPSNAEAARLYAEGLVKLRAFDAPAARELLEKAVAADPASALAHSALAAAWSALGYDAKARDQAKQAVDLSAGLSREDRLSVEARYAQAGNAWEKAIDSYRTLWNFFPDNLDYGLQLADVQISAGKGRDALATIETMRKRLSPATIAPRLELTEAEAAGSLSDFRREQNAASRALVAATTQGARLLTARARLLEGGALQGLGDSPKALVAYEEAERIYSAAGERSGVARSLNSRAIVLRQQGELEAAKDMYERALLTYRETGNEGGIVTATINVANVLRQQGDLSGARRRYEESLQSSRKSEDKASESQALNSMGIVLRQQGDFVGARTAYLGALSIRRQTGDQRGISVSLNNLANVLYDLADLAGARKMYEESLAISRGIGDKNGASLALGNIAGVLADQGDLVAATGMYEEELVAARELGSKSRIASALGHIANILQDRGDLARAHTASDEAAAIYREIGETRGLANIQFRLGELLAAEGNLDGARQSHEAALALRNQLAEKGTAAQSRVALASLAMHEGNPKEAEALAREAASTFNAQKTTGDEASALAALARALMLQKRTAEARSAVARAEELARKSQNRLLQFDLTITGARVAAMSGNAAAARQRLEAAVSEAAKLGFRGYEFQARLALGEIEMTAGDVGAGRLRLNALEKDAQSRRFGLIAREAAASAK